MRFEYKDGLELSMSVAGEPLWRYSFGTAEAKPYIHPLRTPSGIELTAFEPWDHQWHRGLWFSWQYINDVNYWEERHGVPQGVGQGTIRFVGPELVHLSPKGAEVRTHYEYLDHTGLDVLESVRTLHFYMPKQGRYIIDWDVSWYAKTDVVIRRTPEDWGGYSGLSLRMARTMGKVRVLNSNGQEGEAAQHQPARWVDISGHADGGWERVGGVTMMEHPDNFRAPNAWKVFGQDGFAFMNPSPVMSKPIHWDTGAGFAAKYRIAVHDGMPSKEELDEAFDLYIAK